MGVLEKVEDGAQRTLSARVIVGRGRACVLRLADRRVSGEHAAIWWDGARWVLRDLLSRNGTFLGERRLEAGENAPLSEGDVIAFGGAESRWRLSDASPPEAAAVAEDGERRGAEGGVLALPDADHPEAVVFLDAAGRWVVEYDAETAPAVDRGEVVAGGRTWRLLLPTPLEETVEAHPDQMVVESLTMRFAVSRDEEYVEVTARQGLASLTLEPRSYHYLLLTLARIQLDEAGLPASERGWVHAEDLSRMLGLDRRTLNVHICRARQQLGKAGVDGAARLILRRPGTGQLRLGCADVEVAPL